MKTQKRRKVSISEFSKLLASGVWTCSKDAKVTATYLTDKGNCIEAVSIPAFRDKARQRILSGAEDPKAVVYKLKKEDVQLEDNGEELMMLYSRDSKSSYVLADVEESVELVRNFESVSEILLVDIRPKN